MVLIVLAVILLVQCEFNRRLIMTANNLESVRQSLYINFVEYLKREGVSTQMFSEKQLDFTFSTYCAIFVTFVAMIPVGGYFLLKRMI